MSYEKWTDLLEDGKPVYRIANRDEWYADVNGVAQCSMQHTSGAVRILVKIETPKPRRWIYEEEPEMRTPRKGDLFISHEGAVHVAYEDWEPVIGRLRTILRLVEKPQ